MTSWPSYLGATENWLLDPGATDHLMLFGSDFTEYMVYSESHETILLGDGATTLQTLGKGMVTHWVETAPNKFHEFTLKNVLHVDVERHDGGERQDILMGSILLYTTMKIPTVT